MELQLILRDVHSPVNAQPFFSVRQHVVSL